MIHGMTALFINYILQREHNLHARYYSQKILIKTTRPERSGGGGRAFTMKWMMVVVVGGKETSHYHPADRL